MYLGKVVGTVVSTTKNESLVGFKLLVIKKLDEQWLYTDIKDMKFEESSDYTLENENLLTHLSIILEKSNKNWFDNNTDIVKKTIKTIGVGANIQTKRPNTAPGFHTLRITNAVKSKIRMTRAKILLDRIYLL